jgi:SNF2 family DNA or RNA helicase
MDERVRKIVEKIDEMIQKKKHLAEMTVASGENWIGKLSNRELREIFGWIV